MNTLPTAIITRASIGIGATYTERLAHRGHSLVLVARDKDCLEALAKRLSVEAKVSIDVIQADLIQ